MIISIEREHDICKYFPFIYTLQKKDTEDLISSIYCYIYTNQSALRHNNDFLSWLQIVIQGNSYIIQYPRISNISSIAFKIRAYRFIIISSKKIYFQRMHFNRPSLKNLLYNHALNTLALEKKVFRLIEFLFILDKNAISIFSNYNKIFL